MQNVKLDMKNENKTTSVLILIFSGKNGFWNQKKPLKNEILMTFADQVFIEKGYKKKEICRILGFA